MSKERSITEPATSGTPDGQPEVEQPRWRQDFPIDWREDEFVSRRELVKFMVLTSAAFAAGQAWLVAKSASSGRRSLPVLPVVDVDEVPVGGATTFTYPEGSSPRLLVRTGPTSFVAYDQQCTHLLCPVVPRVAEGKLHCPCHNGWFDLESGRVLSGPPQRALPRVHVELRDGVVYATGLDEGAT